MRLRQILGKAFPGRQHQILAWLRESCPVSRLAGPAGDPVWVLTRADDVRAGLLDPRLSVQCSARHPRRAIDVTLMNYDPPQLTRIRRLATPSLTQQRIDAHRPVIEAVARELLDGIEPAPMVDLMVTFAHPFAFRVLCELFAIPDTIRADLHTWMSALFDRSAHTPAVIDDYLDRIDAFVTAEVERRIDEPGHDIWSAIATAWTTQTRVTRAELIALCAMLLLGGLDSVAQMVGVCVTAALTHRELWDRLRADPSLTPRAVAEIQRWDTSSPFATKRRALADIPVGGTVIPAGSAVLLAIAAANRDPRRHEHPHLLDLERPRLDRHVAFGLGRHHCLGAALAKLELAVAVTELVAHYPRAALAVPETQLRWVGNYLHRRLAELPVALSPDRGRP